MTRLLLKVEETVEEVLVEIQALSVLVEQLILVVVVVVDKEHPVELLGQVVQELLLLDILQEQHQL